MDLKDKVVVITGGAGLIGRQFAEAVCLHGGIAVVADIDRGRGEEVVSMLKKDNPTHKLMFAEIDICSRESIRGAIDEIHGTYGRIDALVNNAYPRSKNYGRKFEDVEYVDFCENIDLHLGGYFLMGQQFCDYFDTQGYGNIINIASIYGVKAPRFDIYEGTSMTMPVEYAVIKSALIHLTKYMAVYHKGKNIRVNTMSLGGILDKQPESFQEAYRKSALNKGMLDSTDVVGSLVYLLSDYSQYVNGQNLIIDDGWTL